MMPLNPDTAAVVVMDVDRAIQAYRVVDDSLWGETARPVTDDGVKEAHRLNIDAISKAFVKQALDIAKATEPFINPIDQFLDELYVMQLHGSTREGIDLVMSTMHFWLARDGAELCDAILDKVDVSKLKSDLLLAFLTITFIGRRNLKRRSAFYARAKREIRKDCGWLVSHRLLSPLK